MTRSTPMKRCELCGKDYYQLHQTEVCLGWQLHGAIAQRDEALADAEAWRARAERWRAAAQRWQAFACVLKNDAVAMSQRDGSKTAKREQEICAACYRVVADRIREDCQMLFQQEARPAEPSKPGGGEP